VKTQAPSTAPVTTLRGRIAKVYFSAGGFSAGILDCEGAMVRFAGPFCVSEDDLVLFEGKYESSKYGLQLRVTQYSPDVKLDAHGLMRFLATSKRFKGVGEVRARELVKRFGEDFDHIVVDEPERLCEVRGISHEIADGIREEWLRRRQQANAITFLAAFGLTPHQVDKLLEAFGDSAVQVVRDNPYILMEKVDGFGFRRADEVALKTGVLRTNPHRIRAGLLYAMQKASEDGNTCLSRPDFLRQAVDLLVLDDDDAFDRVREALAILVEGGELVEFQGADERPYVALAFLYKMEMAIAAIFRNRGGCSVR